MRRRSRRRPERLTERRDSPARIKALTDGIFSVAMTLLVLGLAVNAHETSAQNANADFWRFLTASGLGWKFLWFLASFAVASWFWVAHLQVFWTIESVDRQVVWLNTLFFAPVVLSPFTTILVAQFPHANYAAVVYVADILGASLTLDGVWFYCVHAGLVSKETPELVSAVSRRLIFVTVAARCSVWSSALLPVLCNPCGLGDDALHCADGRHAAPRRVGLRYPFEGPFGSGYVR